MSSFARPTRCAAFLCVALLFAAHDVRADIAPEPMTGGKALAATQPGKTLVEMTSEVVRLSVWPDRCETAVDFVMTNTGDADETIEVGFPYGFADEMQDFRVEINGRQIEVVRKVRNGSKLDRVWETWTMTFPPRKPVRVNVRYKNPLRGDEYQNEYRWHLSREGDLQDLVDSLPDDKSLDFLRQPLEAIQVRYLLATGSHWRGSIGRCRIELTMSGDAADCFIPHRVTYGRSDPASVDGKLVWDLVDLEPEYDFYLRFVPGLSRSKFLETINALPKKHPSNLYAVELLYGLRILEGRPAEGEKLFLDYLSRNFRDFDVPLGGSQNAIEARKRTEHLFTMLTDGTGVNQRADSRIEFRFTRPYEFIGPIRRLTYSLEKRVAALKPKDANEKRILAYFMGRISQFNDWCEVTFWLPELTKK
jgi:hypothetical protein